MSNGPAYVYTPEDGDAIIIGQQAFPHAAAVPAVTLYFISDPDLAEEIRQALAEGRTPPLIEPAPEVMSASEQHL